MRLRSALADVVVGAQHAEQPAHVHQRRPRVGRDAGQLAAAVSVQPGAPERGGLGADRDHRQVVRDHVVELAGDPVALLHDRTAFLLLDDPAALLGEPTAGRLPGADADAQPRHQDDEHESALDEPEVGRGRRDRDRRHRGAVDDRRQDRDAARHRGGDLHEDSRCATPTTGGHGSPLLTSSGATAGVSTVASTEIRQASSGRRRAMATGATWATASRPTGSSRWKAVRRSSSAQSAAPSTTRSSAAPARTSRRRHRRGSSARRPLTGVSAGSGPTSRRWAADAKLRHHRFGADCPASRAILRRTGHPVVTPQGGFRRPPLG